MNILKIIPTLLTILGNVKIFNLASATKPLETGLSVLNVINNIIDNRFSELKLWFTQTINVINLIRKTYEASVESADNSAIQYVMLEETAK